MEIKKPAPDEVDKQNRPSIPRKLPFSLKFRSSSRAQNQSDSRATTRNAVRHVDVKVFKKDLISEILEKSKGLEEVLHALNKTGSNLWKVRSPQKWYRRRYVLDLGEMSLKYDRPYKTTCISNNKRHIDFSDIVDIRKGWKTDIFNKVGAAQDRMKAKVQDYKTTIEERNSFSIIYGTRRRDTLDLVAANPEIADKWVRCLEYILSWQTSKKQEKSYENWLRNKFLAADLDGNKCLSFEETMRLFKELNIDMQETEAKVLFDEANIKRASSPENDVLDEDEFIQFYFKLLKRPEIEALFDSYCSTKGILKANELRQFLQKEQSDYASASIEDCHDLIVINEKSDLKYSRQMSCAGFLNMLLASRFDIFKDEQKGIYQDMDQPLSHYYIASSHNTYLMGNQLSSNSSVEGYVDALKRGCRCVEIDIWDGDEGEPMVTHGRTLTTKIPLKEVLDDAIKQYAFFASKYPLILSLENHCTAPVQQKVADYMNQILGDMLYTEDVTEDMKFLPSPNQLINKILLKGKKTSAKSAFYVESVQPIEIHKVSDGSIGKTQIDVRDRNLNALLIPTTSTETESQIDSDESGNESGEETKVDSDNASIKRQKTQNKIKVSGGLSSLINLIQATHFKTFAESRIYGKCYQMSSFSEAKSLKFIDEEPGSFVSYNICQLSRIYPGGVRTGSSNFDPIQFWNVGCQMVALNYQTEDIPNYMNFARFVENGSCGYVLKPEFLRNPTNRFDPNEEIDRDKGVVLRIRIISGQHLPKAPGNPEIVDPYVEIKITGMPQDKKTFTTQSIRNNGFNPTWNKSFETIIRFPELALMYIRVKDYAQTGIDVPLAHFAIPINAISSGYRHLQLQNLRGEAIQPSTLFVQVSITDSNW